MKIKFFYSGSDYIQERLSIADEIDKKRLSKAYGCLKKLGKFDTRIEVFSLDNDNYSYVVDNNGRKFYFDVFSQYYRNEKKRRRVNYSIAEEVREGKYILYDFFLDKLEKVETIYTFDDIRLIRKRHPYLTDSYIYSYVDKKLIYNLYLCNGLDIDDKFISQNILHQPKTLIDYVDNFKAVADMSNYEWVDFESEKNVDLKENIIVSKIDYYRGKLKKLDVVEETSDEYLHMWLEDGELKEKVVHKISLPIDKADKKLQKTYKSITNMAGNKKV